MPYNSRWQIDIPNSHLATLLLQSPTKPLSQTHKCLIDPSRLETHYFTPHDFRLWSQRFAPGLSKSGLKMGDRVLLFSGNDLFFPVALMGTDRWGFHRRQPNICGLWAGVPNTRQRRDISNLRQRHQAQHGNQGRRANGVKPGSDLRF